MFYIWWLSVSRIKDFIYVCVSVIDNWKITNAKEDVIESGNCIV